MPDELVNLKLPRNHVGHILDGLRCREQAYRDTAEYLETGRPPAPDFAIEEVRDTEEARSLAEFYREIIESVEQQLRTTHKP